MRRTSMLARTKSAERLRGGRMNSQLIFVAASIGATLGIANAQTFERRAMLRGGDPNHGKCTIEVVVDGAADVEIRGDNAVLRNLSGQPAQWRRFECTAPLPANPGDFHFSGVDGRGRQQLIRDPRSGGVVVVRIEDPDHGADKYKFDLTWNNDARYLPPPDDRNRGYPDPRVDRDRDHRDGDYRDRDDRDGDRYYRDRDEWFRGQDWRARFFQRIRLDLDHVRSETFPSGGDQYRLSRTLQELDELQDKLARGFYDERELNEVIGAMQRVLEDNRLSRRDRELLADDLNRMRDFRERHEYYGAR